MWGGKLCVLREGGVVMMEVEVWRLNSAYPVSWKNTKTFLYIHIDHIIFGGKVQGRELVNILW